jgi:Zn-finger nucleic acid-binding protein/ribosomal protein S27AE
MLCPIDGTPLKQVRRHRMKVDECPTCKGMWLSAPELDQLEDIKFDIDDLKGTLLLETVETSLPCPYCKANLHEFKYRFYQLRLDRCPNQHGFWLDHSEDKRILQIMDKRKKDLVRKRLVDNSWSKRLRSFRWFSFSMDPDSCIEEPGIRPTELPPFTEVRPPAIPAQPTKKPSTVFKRYRLPATCPRCGGPINSLTVIKDDAEQFICGYCHTLLSPAR